ncbi:cation diffusion facilitator family transporter [Rhodocytophaga rosea]|uniref:Cation diffusion facilitator family transporter n=1 Tax=Rhodocytophaga rosea TaxID=2704465 RepID=A0A6C0GFQ3_9BACT|nr:cation diffusion facilitator family transporter [Rhodocytophaga rosea]QHT66739.1 cation diffusion facilitator family transporter [Rhodocytophaga rosea]
MKTVQNFEYPPELVRDFNKAKKIEWITIVYLVITVGIMYATMGNSQAMKTAWFEDIMSLTPSISFLIASRIFTKPTNKEFPYGYHRVVSIAYLCSSLALFTVGGFLVIDSAMTLIKAERPTIGIVMLFGKTVWLGYIMILALLWGTLPAVFLGRIKLPISKKLHEKNLYTDAEMQKADWMTGVAAILGILGIGMGWWWADAVAASIISLDIIYDGFTNVKQAVFDLMNQIPKTISKRKTDPLLEKIKEILSNQNWIQDFRFRLREEGHVCFGEGFIIPKEDKNLVDQINSLEEEIQKLDWRIQEFLITPVKQLPKGG